jgi:mannosyltransferase
MWRVDRPALWIDESASVVATQRTWSHLWQLFGGAEAPLVPYYAMLKLIRGTIAWLSPAVAANSELAFRLPSIGAAVLAVWILTVWLARHSAVLALTTTTALLVGGGFTRYGQEARPYAFALLAAVIATVTWATMITDSRRRWIGLYAVSVTFLVVAHLLAGSLVAAHLVAALITPQKTSPTAESAAPETTSGWAQRRSAVIRTLVGSAIGVAAVTPLALPAATQGTGPLRDFPRTWDHFTTTFLGLFTEGARISVPTRSGPILGVGLLVLLAAIGLVQAFLNRYRFIARIAATWAIIPPLVLFPVVASRPNLITARYLVFIIPGWAILTGLGVITVADLGRRLANHRSADRRPVAETVIGGVTAVLVLTLLVATQVSTMTGVRTPGSHGEDIRPALALADQPQYASLPIVMAAPERTLEIAAYRRADESRILGQRIPRERASIWPIEDNIAARQRAKGQRRLIVLLRTPTSRSKCPGPNLAGFVRRCMPKWVRQEGYRVETAKKGGHKWTFAVVARPEGGAGTESGQEQPLQRLVWVVRKGPRPGGR